jgi:hypothetical protein
MNIIRKDLLNIVVFFQQGSININHVKDDLDN